MAARNATARRGLDDDRAPRRPCDAEVEPVDRHHLEDEVGDVGHDDDDERLAEVGDAPQHAVADEGDEHERQADGADAQVDDGRVQHLALAAEDAGRGLGERRDEHGEGHAEEQRQPERLHADAGRRLRPPGAPLVGEPLGGAVGQEVAAGDDEEQDR